MSAAGWPASSISSGQPTSWTHGGDNHAPGVPEAKLIGGPLADNPEAAKSASPITYVAADNPPFLIIHWTNDPAVNFKQSERFFSALQKAGVDVTFVRVVGGGHGNFPTPGSSTTGASILRQVPS